MRDVMLWPSLSYEAAIPKTPEEAEAYQRHEAYMAKGPRLAVAGTHGRQQCEPVDGRPFYFELADFE